MTSDNEKAQVGGQEKDWDQPERFGDRAEQEGLNVDVDGFEGPLDLLLALARTQKVDLKEITEAMNAWLLSPPPDMRAALAEWAEERGIECD